MGTFATKNGLNESFVEAFKKFPPFKPEYGAYSARAIKKLLPLMRCGKYWDESLIDDSTKERIEKVITEKSDYAIFTAEISKATFGLAPSDYNFGSVGGFA